MMLGDILDVLIYIYITVGHFIIHGKMANTLSLECFT